MNFLKEVFSRENVIIVGFLGLIFGLFFVASELKGIKEEVVETSDKIEIVVEMAEALLDSTGIVLHDVRIKILSDSTFRGIDEKVAMIWAKARILEGLAEVKYVRALKALGTVDTTGHK